MIESESLNNSLVLTEIVEKGGEYTITEEVVVEHMSDKQRISKLRLYPGDVIRVQSYDPTFGLAFTLIGSSKLIIISPREAQKIRVEPVE